MRTGWRAGFVGRAEGLLSGRAVAARQGGLVLASEEGVAGDGEVPVAARAAGDEFGLVVAASGFSAPVQGDRDEDGAGRVVAGREPPAGALGEPAVASVLDAVDERVEFGGAPEAESEGAPEAVDAVGEQDLAGGAANVRPRERARPARPERHVFSPGRRLAAHAPPGEHPIPRPIPVDHGANEGRRFRVSMGSLWAGVLALWVR